jgi:hypothetical protein
MAVLDMLFRAVEFVLQPPHTWPTYIRRAYVCLFPLMWPLRMLALTVFVIIALPLACLCYVILSIDAIWHGKRLDI